MSLQRLHNELDGIYRDHASNFQDTPGLRDRIGTCMDLANAAGAHEIRDALVQFLNTLSTTPNEAGVVIENIRLRTLQLMPLAA